MATPVSVIIPCHDRPALLRTCLASIIPQTDGGSCEIVVVDSSRDRTVARVIAEFSGVRRIAPAEHLEPGPARNLGVRETAHPMVAFLDADCRPDPQWLQAARAVLAGEARVVGGPILDARPWHPVAAAAHFMQCADCGPRRPAGPAPYLAGCNLAMARTTFTELGGFTSGRGEDTRLTSAAAAQWPGRVVFEPRMAVHHASFASLSALWQRSAELGADRARGGPPLKTAQWFGRSTPGALVAAAARFAYLGVRTLQWHPRSVVRFLLFAPLVLIGLMSWGLGFARASGPAAR